MMHEENGPASNITFGRALSMPSVREAANSRSTGSATFYMQAPRPAQIDAELGKCVEVRLHVVFSL